jgi:hypothetical protein
MDRKLQYGLELDLVNADLHNHLRTGSKLSRGDFNRAIDIAERRLGAGGIFAMVNFEDNRYEKFVKINGYKRTYLGDNKNGFYVPEKNIYVVKGQEVPTREGHILVLGLGNKVRLKSGRSLDDSLKEAKDNNGIIVADHPFYWQGVGPLLAEDLELTKRFDAIEIHNGEASFGIPCTKLKDDANLKASLFYFELPKKIGIGALSCSDGHSFRELGTSWTSIESLEGIEPKNFVEELRKRVRNTGVHHPRKYSHSYSGAMEHIGKLVLIKAVNKLKSVLGYEKDV